MHCNGGVSGREAAGSVYAQGASVFYLKGRVACWGAGMDVPDTLEKEVTELEWGDMPEEVHFNRELNLIEVRSHGVVTGRDVVQSLKKIEQMAGLTGVPRVLIDTREQVSGPGVFALQNVSGRLPDHTRFAIVSQADHPAQSGQQVAQATAEDAGFQVRVFVDHAAAVKWLSATGL